MGGHIIWTNYRIEGCTLNALPFEVIALWNFSSLKGQLIFHKPCIMRRHDQSWRGVSDNSRVDTEETKKLRKPMHLDVQAGQTRKYLQPVIFLYWVIIFCEPHLKHTVPWCCREPEFETHVARLWTQVRCLWEAPCGATRIKLALGVNTSKHITFPWLLLIP